MPYETTTYKVMIASPGDVQSERKIVRDVIHKWNAYRSEKTGIMLHAIGWDTHSYPDLAGRAQALLNRQVLKDSDLLVAIFWTRLGTPTGKSPSGTVEEIKEHIAAGKPAMVYFSDRPIPPSEIDSDQRIKLDAFIQECRELGLVEAYGSEEEFSEKFERQLELQINNHPVFKAHRRNKYKVPSSKVERDLSERDKPVLGPSSRMREMLSGFPPELTQGQIAIDGALEIMSFSQPGNRYGGLSRSAVTMDVTNEEWSVVPNSGALSKESTQKLAAGLLQWMPKRRAKPNRIRFLLAPPVQPVLDHNELVLSIGNSDYFTMRAVTELSRHGDSSTGRVGLDDVFDCRWGASGVRFRPTCVPYHISAQGTLFVTEPDSGNSYLILTSPSSHRTPIAPGWNATFAEQMWAPSPSKPVRPWWERFVGGLDIEAPTNRRGDVHIEGTLIRGINEELGIGEQEAEEARPKLISAIIEPDMYFVAFLFVIEVTMTLKELYRRKESASDREIGAIAAFPIQGFDKNGKVLNPAEQFAHLLRQENFDAGSYALPGPQGAMLRPWHLSSRMRIYSASRHLVGDEMLDYVELVT